MVARTSRMLSAEQNDLMTRTNPGTAAGGLLRRYWQPAALVDELAGNRPVKPVRLLGEDLVLFRDPQGRMACWRAPARIAALIWRSDGWRTAACVARSTAGCSTSPAAAWRPRPNPTA